MVALCKKIAEASWFNNSITCVILIAGILVGIDTYSEFAEQHRFILEIANKLGVPLSEYAKYV